MRRAVLGLALLALVLRPGVAATIYFGEDRGLGETVRLPAHPNSDWARSQFLSGLQGVGTETFESFAAGTGAPLALTFPGAGNATLNGGGSIVSVPSGTNGYGRYPISGSKFWETNQSLAIDFSHPVAAFGFYGVDIGDFSGHLYLTTIAGVTRLYNVPHTVGGPGGGVLYWGIIDAADPFVSIQFGTTSGSDWFGFDDMTIGSVQQVVAVPEPGTLALLGGGLVAMVRRRRAVRAR